MQKYTATGHGVRTILGRGYVLFSVGTPANIVSCQMNKFGHWSLSTIFFAQCVEYVGSNLKNKTEHAVQSYVARQEDLFYNSGYAEQVESYVI